MGLFNRLFGQKPQDAPPERVSESVATMETYLRGIFGFIGVTDIRVIRIQGTMQNKPEQIEADTRKAIAEASDAAMEFAGKVAVKV